MPRGIESIVVVDLTSGNALEFNQDFNKSGSWI